MSATVIPFRRCKCGAGGKPLELAFGDEVIGNFVACDSCLLETAATIERVRPVFDAMIAVGVSRDHANQTMTHLLDLVDPPDTVKP